MSHLANIGAPSGEHKLNSGVGNESNPIACGVHCRNRIPELLGTQGVIAHIDPENMRWSIVTG